MQNTTNFLISLDGIFSWFDVGVDAVASHLVSGVLTKVYTGLCIVNSMSVEEQGPENFFVHHLADVTLFFF